MGTKQFSYLIIGCGSIGKRHIRNLLSLGRKVSVFDADQSLLARLSNSYPTVSLYSSLEEALGSNPDIAVICTPTSTHVKIAIKSAEKGIHLFIEKPVSHNLERLDELETVIKKHRVISLVGCNMRFQYGIKRIATLTKKLGRIYLIRCQFGYYLPYWRPGTDYKKTYSSQKKMGGGIILDAIHEFDYLVALMNKKPVNITAFLQKSGLIEVDVEDNAAIIIQFNDGSIGEIHLDCLSRCYRRTCEVGGEKGVVHWDETYRTIKTWNRGSNKWQVSSEPQDYDYNESYVEELLHLEKSIRANIQTVNPVSEATKVLKLALAAKESAKKGKHIAINW